MTDDGAQYRGHACIVVGDAKKLVKAGMRVQVNALVALLRQAGADDSYLRSVAVVLYPNGEFAGGGGKFFDKAELTYRPRPGAPLRRFSSVLHINAATDRSLPFVLLHEAGHLWAFSRGKGGKVLDSARNQRLLRAFGCVMMVALAAAMITTAHWLTLVCLALAVMVAVAPDMVLWWLSPAEIKANLFYRRRRKHVFIGTTDDGTEYLFAPHFNVNR